MFSENNVDECHVAQGTESWTSRVRLCLTEHLTEAHIDSIVNRQDGQWEEMDLKWIGKGRLDALRT